MSSRAARRQRQARAPCEAPAGSEVDEAALRVLIEAAYADAGKRVG